MNTTMITNKPSQAQGYVCPVCGLDRMAAAKSGYLASISHCDLICRAQYQPKSNYVRNVLPAALGEYTAKGFSLVEQDDHLLELLHEGIHVAHFTQHATIEAIRSSCEAHLTTGECW